MGKVEESLSAERERGTVRLSVEFELSTLNFEYTQKENSGDIQMDPTFNSSSFSFRIEIIPLRWGSSLSVIKKSGVVAITLSLHFLFSFFFYHNITISFPKFLLFFYI